MLIHIQNWIIFLAWAGEKGRGGSFISSRKKKKRKYGLYSLSYVVKEKERERAFARKGALFLFFPLPREGGKESPFLSGGEGEVKPFHPAHGKRKRALSPPKRKGRVLSMWEIIILIYPTGQKMGKKEAQI